MRLSYVCIVWSSRVKERWIQIEMIIRVRGFILVLKEDNFRKTYNILIARQSHRNSMLCLITIIFIAVELLCKSHCIYTGNSEVTNTGSWSSDFNSFSTTIMTQNG
jgi:ribosomal protein L31